MKILVITLVIACFVTYYQVVIKHTGRLNANAIFVYLNTLMAVGSLTLVELSSDADATYGRIITYTLLTYLAASAVLVHSAPRSARFGTVSAGVSRAPGGVFWLFALLSAAIVALYFREVGASAFLQGLRAQFGGASADVATIRLEAYSGSRYLFPGYVNQFKNALQPALFVVALTYWLRAGVLRSRLFVVLPWGAYVLFGLVGTGQRGAFIIFSLVILVFAYLANGEKLPKGTGFVFAGVITVLLASTIALDRGTDSASDDGSVTSKVQEAAPQLTDRVLSVNQGSAVIGFRYIYHYESIQNGQEWKKAALGILPGETGSDLANKIFAYRYGSDRGTSPPSNWGSIYHNFGWYGIAIAPIILAMVLVRVTRLGMAPITRDPLELIGIAGTFVVLGFWVAGDPMFLLNNGLVVYLLLWYFGGQARRSRQRAAVTPRPRHPSPVRRTGPSGRRATTAGVTETAPATHR